MDLQKYYYSSVGVSLFSSDKACPEPGHRQTLVTTVAIRVLVSEWMNQLQAAARPSCIGRRPPNRLARLADRLVGVGDRTMTLLAVAATDLLYNYD